jgi:hypothetical protein
VEAKAKSAIAERSEVPRFFGVLAIGVLANME